MATFNGGIGNRSFGGGGDFNTGLSTNSRSPTGQAPNAFFQNSQNRKQEAHQVEMDRNSAFTKALDDAKRKREAAKNKGTQQNPPDPGAQSQGVPTPPGGGLINKPESSQVDPTNLGLGQNYQDPYTPAMQTSQYDPLQAAFGLGNLNLDSILAQQQPAPAVTPAAPAAPTVMPNIQSQNPIYDNGLNSFSDKPQGY